MRGIDRLTSRMQSDRSTIWATSPVRRRGANDIWSLSSVNAMVEQSFLLHMVVKLALSMRVINPCVSHMPIACPFVWHASLLGSKAAGYVRRMSLIVSRVMFPSKSFWGKPWRFRAQFALSASSVLFQMLPFAFWTYKSMSFFDLTKQLPVFPFLISGLLWKIGDAGHRSPYLSHAERALYHLSYNPTEETGTYCLIKHFLCYWNSWTESSFAYRCNIGFADAGHQSMCFSHASRLPSWWTYFAGEAQRSCLCQTDVFDCLISGVMFASTSLWGKLWRFGAPIAFSASSLLFQMLRFASWTYISMSFFDLTK